MKENNDNELNDLNSLVGLTLNDAKEILDCTNYQYRIWRPNTLGTADYVVTRLNVTVNDKDIVEGVYWG